MYHSIKRGLIASVTGMLMVVSGFVAPAQAANNYLIDCSVIPGPEYTNTSSDENFYGNWDVYLGGTQTEIVNVTIQNCNIHLARDNSGYFYNDYSGTLEPVAYELTVTPGGAGEARGYNAGFGEPAFITLIINFYNSVDPNYVEPAFAIKDGNGNGITSITGNVGAALNESYDVVLVGDGWQFGQPGKGWGYSFTSRPNSGVNYALTLNGAYGEPQSFTMTVTGTPTQGYYRDQSLRITDDNGQSFTYYFKLAIDGSGVTNVVTNPNAFTYGDPSLPTGKSDLFLGDSVPVIYAVNPADSTRIPILPTEGYAWDKLVTENNGVTTYTYGTDTLFMDDVYGSIRANVTIAISDYGYSYQVETYSWDYEGEPYPVELQFEAALASGSNYSSGTTGSMGTAIMPQSTSLPFAVFSSSNGSSSTPIEDGDTLTLVEPANSFTEFMVQYYDYSGCPDLAELIYAYDYTEFYSTGYVSENECVFPEEESFAGANIKFDEAIVYVGEPGMANQISETDDIGRAASVGDFIDYLNVTTVNGVVYNAILTVDNVVGGYYDFPGDNIVAKIDDHTSTTEENPRIRTRFAYDAGDGDRYVEYTLYFYAANDEAKSPVTVSDLMLNVYDIDWYQFMELNNVSSYILSEGSELTATNTDGVWRFEDANGNDSDSTDESRVQANLNAFSTLTVRLGISAGDTSDASASYALDFSSGTEWIIPQAEPKTNEYDPNSPEPEPTPEPTPEPQPAPRPSMQVDPITPPTIGGKTGFETDEKVAVSGKTLDGLTKVMVGGVEVEFTNNTSTGLVITLPKLADGVYDLVLIGAYGTLTYQSAIKIVTRVASVEEESVKPIKATKLFSGFAPDSALLTSKMKSEIRLWLKKYPNISLVNITGMTQGPTVLKGDPKLAQRRAIVVKAYIKSIMPDVKFAKTRIKNQTITNAKYRGAVITVTYTK